MTIKNNVQDLLHLSELISLTDILEDKKTIATKTGTVLQVLKIQGKDYTGMNSEDCEAFWKERKAFFDYLPSETRITIHYHRKEYKIENRNPETGNKYADEILIARNKKFSTSFRTDMYIVISLPDKRKIKNITGIHSKNLAREMLLLDKAIADLSGITDTLASKLHTYKPEILRHTKDGKSPLLSFWNYILKGGNLAQFQPVETLHLNAVLATTPIEFRSRMPKILEQEILNFSKKNNIEEDQLFDLKNIIRKEIAPNAKDHIIFHNENKKIFANFLSIAAYPDETDYNILNNLMTQQVPFNVIQHVKINDNEVVKQKITARSTHWSSISSFSAFVRQDMQEFAEGLEAGRFKEAEHIFSICVFGDNPHQLNENTLILQRALAKSYITTIRETINTDACYLSQFPDCEDCNEARSAKHATTTIADFVNFGTKSQGNLSCSFGDEPVCFFKTLDGQNYAFTPHPTTEKYAPGHTLIIGGTGKGKTVTMADILFNCLKFQGDRTESPLKAVIFDSYKSMKIPTCTVDGDYINFDENKINLNPFQMERSEVNDRFLRDFIATLANGLDDYEEELVQTAIRNNYELLKDPSMRSLDAIRASFGVEISGKNTKPNLAYRLKKWMPNNEDPSKSDSAYGFFFNGKEDALNFNKRVIGFDMTSIIKGKSELLAPLTSYIFHAFEQHVTRHPCPHLIVMDEAINFMNNPHLLPYIRRMLLEERKRNGVFMAAVQDIGLMLEKLEVAELLKHFQTFFIYQNAAANKADYLNIGLTETEFAWVKSQSAGRHMMIKRKDGESVIVEVDLSHLKEKLVYYRSEQDLVMKAEKLMLENPGDWRERLPN